MGVNEQMLMKEIKETINNLIEEKRVFRRCKKCGARIPLDQKRWICDRCRHEEEYARHYVSCEQIRKKEREKEGKKYERKCWYCKKKFKTDNPFLRYCHDKCRELHHNTDVYKGTIWMNQWNEVNNYREEKLEY